MFYILLCILSNVGIFLCFHAFSHFKANTFQAIVFNYAVCIATGIIFIGDAQFVKQIDFSAPWVLIAGGLGTIFIGTFYLMALTTQRMGITVATIASKMSLVIPVLISIFIFMIQSKEYTWLNYVGIFLALVAIFLASIKPRKEKGFPTKGWTALLMPLAVFIFGGLIDTAINYTSHKYITPGNEAIFPLLIFTAAFIIGVVALAIRRNKIELKNVVGGVALGILNYFSIYFLVKGLGAFNNDGAIVYPVLNVGIILVSGLLSVVIFKEKLNPLNKAGLALAVVAVMLVFYQEIVAYI